MARSVSRRRVEHRRTKLRHLYPSGLGRTKPQPVAKGVRALHNKLEAEKFSGLRVGAVTLVQNGWVLAMSYPHTWTPGQGAGGLAIHESKSTIQYLAKDAGSLFAREVHLF